MSNPLSRRLFDSAKVEAQKHYGKKAIPSPITPAKSTMPRESSRKISYRDLSNNQGKATSGGGSRPAVRAVSVVNKGGQNRGSLQHKEEVDGARGDTAAANVEMGKGGCLQVLLAEDSIPNQKLMIRILERAGHLVNAVRLPRTCLLHARQSQAVVRHAACSELDPFVIITITLPARQP